MKYLILLVALIATTSCSVMDKKTLSARPTVGTQECFDNFGTVRDPDTGIFYYVNINTKLTCVDGNGDVIKADTNSNDMFDTGKDCPAVVYRGKLRDAVNLGYVSSPRDNREERNTSSDVIWKDGDDCYYTCQGFTKVVLYKDDTQWCSDRRIPLLGLKYDYRIDLDERFSARVGNEIRGDIVKVEEKTIKNEKSIDTTE